MKILTLLHEFLKNFRKIKLISLLNLYYRLQDKFRILVKNLKKKFENKKNLYFSKI